MATLSVTTVSTANGTTDLILRNGNTSGPTITIPSGSSIVAVNGSINAVGNVYSSNLITALTKLQVGSHGTGGYDFGSLAAIEIDGNQNTYLQIVVQNANTGNNASSDLIVTNDSGNDTVGFIDLGINSSTYNQASFNLTGAGDGYLYTSNGALVIGTASAQPVIFHSNGTTTTAEHMRITAGGNVGINTTTAGSTLVVNGDANVASNTLYVGVYNQGSTGNGHTMLPNGMKLCFGKVICNTTSTVTFTSAFLTNAVAVTTGVLTSGLYNGANVPYVSAVNNTVATLRSASTTTTGQVYYMAIGY